MMQQHWFGTVVFAAVLLGITPAVPAQTQPVEPLADNNVSLVPVTILLDVDEVRARALREWREIMKQPVPPPVNGRRPLLKGGLIQRIRENRPIAKLLRALPEKLDVLRVEMEKLAEPMPVGEHRWLSLNLKHIALQEINVDGIRNKAAVHLVAAMTPTIVLSEQKPPRMSLPGFSVSEPIPPPPDNGVPISFDLKVDPKSLPQVLPEEAKKEMQKYGVDIAKVTFAGRDDKNGNQIRITAPVQKPLEATLKVSFNPEIKDNVLTCHEPKCEVELPPPTGEEESAFQKSFRAISQKTIENFIVGELKKTRVDFREHFKNLEKLAGGNGKELTGQINDLRVEDLFVRQNHIVARITGRLPRDGIILQGT